MMQYLRTASVTVGKAGENGVTFSGLRVGFDVEKSTISTPNDAKIFVYNLNAKSRAAVEEANLVVRLDVGYRGLNSTSPILSQLFIGNVRYTASSRQGPDWVTVLEAGDGEKAITETTHEQSYPAGTPFDVVIKSLTSKMGVAIGQIAPAIGKVFENGYSFSGQVSKALDDLTKTAGLEWHVTDGELNILPQGGAKTVPAIFVNPNTGLIGSPSKRRPDKTSGDRTGFEFQMLINPSVRPGCTVVLESRVISGPMKVERIRFNGDTHMGAWVATVEAA